MVSRVKESHRPCTPVSQGVSKTSDQEQEQEQADRIAPSGGCDELNWTDSPGWIISGLIILIKASYLPSDCPSLLLRECVLLIGCGFECGAPQLPHLWNSPSYFMHCTHLPIGYDRRGADHFAWAAAFAS